MLTRWLKENAAELSYLAFLAVSVVVVMLQVRAVRRREARARASQERGAVHPDGPHAQHPHIWYAYCIGCGNCVDACPEGDVLAMIGGKAAFVSLQNCVGHGLCAEACCVGAISMMPASGKVSAELPQLTAFHESTVSNLFVAGELTGVALIQHAVNQGRECVDTITARIEDLRRALPDAGIRDVCIVGAGPAGVSASLRAIEKGLTSVTVEREHFGGTIEKYPRQKVINTGPWELPLYGRFSRLEITKEKLLESWKKIAQMAGLTVHEHEEVTAISRGDDGLFTILTTRRGGGRPRYRARAVILAIGRRGTPRTLGVRGEALGKVMYGLLDVGRYTGQSILVVGGGNGAVEAALALAYGRGNRVTLSYRGGALKRPSDPARQRNVQRLDECVATGKITLLLNSRPTEFTERAVRLEVTGEPREIDNDFTWIMCGGETPVPFLQRTGVTLGPRDLTQMLIDRARSPGYVGIAPGVARARR